MVQVPNLPVAVIVILVHIVIPLAQIVIHLDQIVIQVALVNQVNIKVVAAVIQKHSDSLFISLKL